MANLVRMDADHPLWWEFVDRLEGPEGCNFQGEYDENGEVIAGSVQWDCAGGHDKSKAETILRTIPDVDVEASLEYFEYYGGHCDCEILFNVVDYSEHPNPEWR